MKRPNSLYVHIPFCRHICAYCDFPKVVYNDQWAKSYLGALFSEIKSRDIGKVKTIFVGGGTPTSLGEEDFWNLLEGLSAHASKHTEFSVEANPETITENKVIMMAENGVSRVSLGMQTTLPRLLELLGRKHTFEDVRRAVKLLKDMGYEDINVDLMYGLPGETMEEVQADLEAFFSLDIPHISAYSLILEPGTEFYAKGIKPLSDDEQQAQFDDIRKTLKEHGYHRYEISNFARGDMECIHNSVYWKDEEYYGVGLGAAGYIGDTRYVNTKNLKKYLEGHYEGEVEKLTKESMIEDYLLTNLRLVRGFSRASFYKRFGIDFMVLYKEKADRLIDRGLLRVTKTMVKATSRGLDLLDTVLVELF